METIDCNLCHSTNAQLRYQLRDYLLEGTTPFTLVKCQNCGLVYQNPRPTLEEIGIFYPPDYDSYNPEPDLEHLPWLLEKAINYGLQKRVRFVTRRKSGGKLLDVGCATGLFLRTLSRSPGWELHGVELSAHAAGIARHRYHLDVFNGTLEQAAYPAESFDAVTLWDVFEHLHNPAGSLHEIWRLLKPGGILVLRVPNGDSWDSRLFGSYWAGLDAPRHLYIFTHQTLGQLLKQNGFEVLSSVCSMGGYPAFLLSLRFWLTEKGINPVLRTRLMKVLNHPITRIITAPTFYLRNLGRQGPALTVTARKNS